MRRREQAIMRLNAGLGVSDAQRVAPFLLPTIGLRDGPLGTEPGALGSTRFGGRPDLPVDVSWPEGPNGPLAFLGQIALADVAGLDVDKALPTIGALSFFYDIHALDYGYDPADCDRFAVVYQPANAKLFRRAFSDEIMRENRIEHIRSVTPYLWWQLPTADPLAQETLGFGDMDDAQDEFTQRYWKLDYDLAEPHIPVGHHQFLGWANGIYQQGEDCRLDCELARRGFPNPGSDAANEAKAQRGDWRCLLEISDDRELYNTSWYDGGSLAFMIRDEDLRNEDFSHCWCMLSTS